MWWKMGIWGWGGNESVCYRDLNPRLKQHLSLVYAAGHGTPVKVLEANPGSATGCPGQVI